MNSSQVLTFSVDTGFIPDRIAQEYGYNEFKDFFESDLLKNVHKLAISDGQPVYVARDCSKFQHIRDEQLISNDTIVRKEDEMEMEKLARALLPQNAEQFINGKKTILKILHDLGGETKEILWKRIQDQYKSETGRELAGDELRKMFQRDKVLKILTQFFKEEVDVWDSNAPGIFYLKLKKPYNEIMQEFDEIIRAQKEAVKKYRTNKRQSHNNGGNYRAKLTMEERFPPVNSLFAPPIDQSVFMEQSTSQSISKPHPPAENNAVNPTNWETNREQSSPKKSADKNCVSLSNSKFQIPTDVKKLNSDAMKKTAQAEGNSPNKRALDWDGQSLTHYDGGNEGTDSGNNRPTNASRNNGKTKEDGSKKKYTSRNDGTYTDSEEEEMDIEDDTRSDVTLMGQNGRRDAQNGTGQQQQQNEKLDLNLPRRMTFDDDPKERSTNVEMTKPTKAVGHQKNIQKFMKDMMEQKGGPTQQMRRTNLSDVAQPNERNAKFNFPAMINGNNETPPPNKEMPHIYADHSNAHTERQQTVNHETHSNAEILHRNHVDVRPVRESLHSIAGNSSFSRPSVNSSEVFQLMDHVEELRKIANERGFSHETRADEGSFTFRRGDKLLIFTEFNEREIRGSLHYAGSIRNERYFPKVDWDVFYSIILGLLSRNFEMPRLQSQEKSVPPPSDRSDERPSSSDTGTEILPWGCPPGFIDGSKKIIELKEPDDIDLRQDNSEKGARLFGQPPSRKNRDKTAAWIMPKVPNSFVGRSHPFPSLKKTVDGHDFLCFFSKVYAFSNHYPARFKIEDQHFSCSEHYYTWRKSKHFGFEVTAEEIMENHHAKVIKQLGHADNLRERQRLGLEPKARAFDHDEWRNVKEKIMLTALRAKFTQNPELGKMLLETEDALLVEASPSDKYWGIGCAMESEAITKPAQWQGLNRMGILLQTLRQELRWGCSKAKGFDRDLTVTQKTKNASLRSNKFSL